MPDKVRIKLLKPRRMPDPGAKRRLNGTQPKASFGPGSEHEVSEATAADLVSRNIAEEITDTPSE